MKGDVGAVAQLLRSGVGKVFPAASLSFGRSRDPKTLVVGDAAADTWFDIASLTKALATTLLVIVRSPPNSGSCQSCLPLRGS